MRQNRPRMLRFGLIALALLAWPAAAGAASLLNETAQAVVAKGAPVTWIGGHRSGMAWKSAAGAAEYRTGRVSGAAGVGMALLGAYDVSGKSEDLNVAAAAGDFLLAAQSPSGAWPASDDPAASSDEAFTSLDDGAAGISDFLWRLYERTGNGRYARAALAGMDWEISQAKAPAGQICPPACVWPARAPDTGRMESGLGHGVAGIAWALNAFAERRAGVDPVRSARYEAYARAAATWLENQMVRVRVFGGEEVARIPVQPGKPVIAPGLESGSAGDAFLFYQLYRTTGRVQYRNDADLLMAGLRADAVTSGTCAGAAWPLDNGRGKAVHAIGIEHGAAGIGWVALQAYKVLITSKPMLAIKDLELARAAGDWLLSSCAEPKGNEQGASPALGNGSAGVAFFLYDLYRATGSPIYSQGSVAARKRVAAARHPGEISWSRGEAGILAMAARLDGWNLDIPDAAAGFDRGR